jgi:hypothetical protein
LFIQLNEEAKNKGHQRNMMTMVVANNNFVASFDDLSDVLPNILGFLSLQDIMCNRRINKKTREAVTNTIVPLTEFCVYSVENYVTMGLPNLQQIRYNAMRVMATVLPNLQQITIGYLGHGHKFSDGEDPDEEHAARTANRISVDIGIISNFSKLRVLDIRSSYCQLGYAYSSIQCSSLNGRYPVFFNSFPLLQKLTTKYCEYLEWDLGMLSGMPLLKELDCDSNSCLTGNINSLRVLKDTLEKVEIVNCRNIEGSFMDLADFPNLKELGLFDTAVTGDIRDIGVNDFSSIEKFTLPKGVYGGCAYEFQHISDGPDLVRAVYLLKKQRPALKYHWYGQLSQASLDWYESVEDFIRPPFNISLVQAGTRVGYAWETPGILSCEVNWLDPEPDRDSSGYEQYIEGLQFFERLISPEYRGFHQPPTEEEYHRLYQESLGGN